MPRTSNTYCARKQSTVNSDPTNIPPLRIEPTARWNRKIFVQAPYETAPGTPIVARMLGTTANTPSPHEAMSIRRACTATDMPLWSLTAIHGRKIEVPNARPSAKCRIESNVRVLSLSRKVRVPPCTAGRRALPQTGHCRSVALTQADQ